MDGSDYLKALRAKTYLFVTSLHWSELYLQPFRYLKLMIIRSSLLGSRDTSLLFSITDVHTASGPKMMSKGVHFKGLIINYNIINYWGSHLNGRFL